jgi:hypothetical protein
MIQSIHCETIKSFIVTNIYWDPKTLQSGEFYGPQSLQLATEFPLDFVPDIFLSYTLYNI